MKAVARILIGAGLILSVPAADKPAATAYEIMERVSGELAFPGGLSKLQLTITSKSGRVSVYKSALFKKEDNYLIHFDSVSKGRVLKVLYNEGGENIYVYSVLDKRFYHKRAADKFEPILESSFAYVDLAGVSMLNFYTPRLAGTENLRNRNCLRVDNLPLDSGEYSRIVAFVDQVTLELVRMDYYDKSTVLSKSMDVYREKIPVKVMKAGVPSDTVVNRIHRLDMADLASGSVSTLELLLSDETARLDPALFRRENIEK